MRTCQLALSLLPLVVTACESPAPQPEDAAPDLRTVSSPEDDAKGGTPARRGTAEGDARVPSCAFVGEGEIERCLSSEHKELLLIASDDGAKFGGIASATIKEGRVQTIERGNTKLIGVSFQLAEELQEGRSSSCVAVFQSGVRGGLARMRYCGVKGEPLLMFKDIVGDETPELLVWIKTTSGEDSLGLKIYASTPMGGEWRRVLANVESCDTKLGRTEFVAQRDQVRFFCRRGDAQTPHLTYEYGKTRFFLRGDAIGQHLDRVLDPARTDAQALESLEMALALPPGRHRHHSLLTVARDRAAELAEAGERARAADVYVAITDMADALPPAEVRGPSWYRSLVEMRWEAAHLYARVGDKDNAIAQLQHIPKDERSKYVRWAKEREEFAPLVGDPAFIAWADSPRSPPSP